MGARASSCPFAMSSVGHSVSTSPHPSPGVQELLQALPAQYALSTVQSDRNEHARLFVALRAETSSPQTVLLSWGANREPGYFSLWLVFHDRRGSLGVITSVISELGVNIAKASAFSTRDGIAVDSFTVDRCVEKSLCVNNLRLVSQTYDFVALVPPQNGQQSGDIDQDAPCCCFLRTLVSVRWAH